MDIRLLRTHILHQIGMMVGVRVAKDGPRCQIHPFVQELMAASLADFCEKAVRKYIQGQYEHGGDIRDRDLDIEINHETIDLFWYTSAKSWPSHLRDHNTLKKISS